MDYTTMTDEELAIAAQEINAEVERRRVMAVIPAQMEELNKQVLNAIGVLAGDAWRAPTGAHDAYPKDWVVSHEGKLWESLVTGNVWEPGVSAWRERAAAPAPAPEWIAPTGAHDAYNVGDKVMFDGMTYESLLDGNTWSPTDYPAGWKLVAAPDSGAPAQTQTQPLQ